MHICFITSEYPKANYPHGGIGTFVKTISHELVKQGVRVSVLGFNYTNNDEKVIEDGITIYRIKFTKIKWAKWIINAKFLNDKLKQIHSENPIDIIETSELGLAFINKIKGIKYIIRLHGGHHFFAESENRKVNIWKGYQEKKSFKKADAFIAVSDFVKTHTEKYLSYNNKKVELINYPINTELFKPLEINIIPNKIVFAGTVCEKKGVKQLIQAFPFVKKQFPDAILEIYGRDWIFPNGNSYISMLKEKILTKIGNFVHDIHFKGTISYSEIPLKYAEAEVCVFPSHMETQGLVAPEAMAMEKTVVFTNLGPGKETIIDFETGLLCDPLNPEDIANKIIWILENKEKSFVIGKKARQFVLNKYGLNTIVNRNIEFYKSMLEK